MKNEMPSTIWCTREAREKKSWQKFIRQKENKTKNASDCKGKKNNKLFGSALGKMQEAFFPLQNVKKQQRVQRNRLMSGKKLNKSQKMNLKKKGENMLQKAQHSRKNGFLIYLEYVVLYECIMFKNNKRNKL